MLTEDAMKMQYDLESASKEADLFSKQLAAEQRSGAEKDRVIASLEEKTNELVQKLSTRTEERGHAEDEVRRLQEALAMPCLQCGESSVLIPELMTALQCIQDELAVKTEEYTSLIAFHQTHMEKHAVDHHEKHKTISTQDRQTAMMSEHKKKKPEEKQHQHHDDKHKAKHKELHEKKAYLIDDHSKKNEDRKARYEAVMVEREEAMENLIKDHMSGMLQRTRKTQRQA